MLSSHDLYFNHMAPAAAKRSATKTTILVGRAKQAIRRMEFNMFEIDF